MTTEIFQWATVILLALIWVKPASSKEADHLMVIRDWLSDIANKLKNTSETREEISGIYTEVLDIQKRVRVHFPTEEEQEEAELRSHFT